MNTTINPRYFFLTILGIVFVLNISIFWPFLTTLVLGISFAVVFYPVYLRLEKHTKPTIAALITVCIFIISICVPLGIIGGLIFQQSTGLYEKIIAGGTPTQYLERLNTAIDSITPAGVEIDLESKIAGIITLVSSNLAQIFATTLNTIFGFFVMILTFFYFLRDGHRWRNLLIMLSPLADSDDEQVLVKLRDAITAVITGHLFVGFIQGVCMGIGLALLGVANSALLGVLAGIASLIPTIGTALVSIPIIIYLFATGDVYAGVGLILWASLIVGMIDNFIHPLIVGKRINLPVLVVLLAVLGGVSLLGPVGIIIGPLLVSLLYALLSIYTHGKV